MNRLFSTAPDRSDMSCCGAALTAEHQADIQRHVADRDAAIERLHGEIGNESRVDQGRRKCRGRTAQAAASRDPFDAPGMLRQDATIPLQQIGAEPKRSNLLCLRFPAQQPGDVLCAPRLRRSSIESEKRKLNRRRWSSTAAYGMAARTSNGRAKRGAAE